MQRLRFMKHRYLSLGSRSTLGLLLLAALGSAGCKLFQSTCSDDDRACLGGGELRSGKVCVRTGDCATGLDCIKNVCTYVGTTQRGGSCIVSAECARGLYCSPTDLQCRLINTDAQGEGGSCATSADCLAGLVCDADVAELFSKGPYGLLPEECRDQINADDTPEQCTLPKTCVKRGTTDFGAVCDSSSSCLPGLFCIPDLLNREQDVCFGGTKLPVEPVSFPLWGGVECPADTKEPVAYFELPRSSGDQDFYRLPFPNDIRRDSDGIDLDAHPRPPADLAPQTAQRFVQESEKLSGFSTNPVVYFRFSQKLQTSDLALSTLRIVDITKASPEYAQAASIAWGPPEVRSNYICPHWLSVYRPIGSPLRPGTTYAAIVTKGVRTSEGAAYGRSADLDALLKSSRPSDASTTKAWEVYAPLRDYLADSAADLDTDEVLNAAVFTTQDASGIVPKLRAAVEQAGAPSLRDMIVCKAGVQSPCEDSTGRGKCHDENDAFTEIHGHVRLPAFQRGTAPYETPEQGGDIAENSDAVEVQGQPDVCFALSVPKETAPDSGYPLLLVAHATGGSFSEQMENGAMAEWAARLPVPSALLAIDMPVHGSRRGSSTRPPEDLYFNLTNPKATRGNALQGAADLMGLALLAAKRIASQDSPTAEDITFDPARVVLYGHSQGATHASLMIGSEPRIRSAVLAGLAGHMGSFLLKQQKPADMSTVLPFLLFDPDTKARLAGGEANPMLALVQGYLDAADPINYARELYLEPTSTAPDGHDVFMVYGLFDSFTVEDTQKAYATAGGLSAVDHDLTVSFSELVAPAVGNVMPGTQARTVGLRTYDPRADAINDQLPQDGHFVAIDTTRGLADVRKFISDALQGHTPAIGQ
jgi:predicted esterase